MNRLIRLTKYLVIAELDADSNKLYIDDLKLSIEYEKTRAPNIIYEAMIYDKYSNRAFQD